MTKEEIQQKYQVLSAQVGDLYFVISLKRAELQGLEKQMAEFHKEHAALNKAYQEVTGAPASAPPPAPSPEA